MVTVGDKIIVVFGREQVLQSSHTQILYDVELTFCSFLSKFTYSKNLKTGTIHLKMRIFSKDGDVNNSNFVKAIPFTETVTSFRL